MNVMSVSYSTRITVHRFIHCIVEYNVHQYRVETELLQHRFNRGAKKTSYLTELIERFQDCNQSFTYQATLRNNSLAWDNNASMR